MMCHAGVPLVVWLNLTLFCAVDSCGWTIVGQSAEDGSSNHQLESLG